MKTPYDIIRALVNIYIAHPNTDYELLKKCAGSSGIPKHWQNALDYLKDPTDTKLQQYQSAVNVAMMCGYTYDKKAGEWVLPDEQLADEVEIVDGKMGFFAPLMLERVGERHIHADLIHAWAEGAELQGKMKSNAIGEPRLRTWHDTLNPNWHSEWEYRIKEPVELTKPSIKDCPFCGKQPTLTHHSDNLDTSKLMSLGCCGFRKVGNEIDLINAWNERHT